MRRRARAASAGLVDDAHPGLEVRAGKRGSAGSIIKRIAAISLQRLGEVRASWNFSADAARARTRACALPSRPRWQPEAT